MASSSAASARKEEASKPEEEARAEHEARDPRTGRTTHDSRSAARRRGNTSSAEWTSLQSSQDSGETPPGSSESEHQRRVQRYAEACKEIKDRYREIHKEFKRTERRVRFEKLEKKFMRQGLTQTEESATSGPQPSQTAWISFSRL